ncbi:MAG: NAD(+)/NADH kinase [Firmicutes bacterium]|nr:NAD(+)/NADH kinase [Bacillota bacterium]
MNPKLIFLDIDGTLTAPGSNTPPESALAAIRRARENGHKIFLCSGRNPAMLSPLMKYQFEGAVAGAGGYVFAGEKILYDCPMEPDDFETPLAELLAGRYKVEQRMMMEAQVRHEGKEPDHTYYAVNDFVIHRDLLDSLLHVQAYVNKEYLAEFRSDGVIVSSPCGSTAYNFSAGGPILSPVADNLILTPLCSHAMLDRSVVLRGDDELSFYLGSYTRADHAAFSIDGSQTIFVGERSWITIRKSQHYFPLAKVGKRSFYEIVQKKMRP